MPEATSSGDPSSDASSGSGSLDSFACSRWFATEQVGQHSPSSWARGHASHHQDGDLSPGSTGLGRAGSRDSGSESAASLLDMDEIGVQITQQRQTALLEEERRQQQQDMVEAAAAPKQEQVPNMPIRACSQGDAQQGSARWPAAAACAAPATAGEGAPEWAAACASAGSRAWRAACALAAGPASQRAASGASAAAASAGAYPTGAPGPAHPTAVPASNGQPGATSRRHQLLQALAAQTAAGRTTAAAGSGGDSADSSNSSLGVVGHNPGSCAALIGALTRGRTASIAHSSLAAGAGAADAQRPRAAQAVGAAPSAGLPPAVGQQHEPSVRPAAGRGGTSGGVWREGGSSSAGGSRARGVLPVGAGGVSAAGEDIQRDLAARMEAIRAQLSSICSSTLASALTGAPEGGHAPAKERAQSAQPQVEGSWGSMSGDGKDA